MTKYRKDRLGNWQPANEPRGLDLLLWLLAVGIPLAAGVVVAAALLGRTD